MAAKKKTKKKVKKSDVRESKDSKDKDDLRGKEWSKILCGKAHFDELKVDFEYIDSVEQIRCQ